MDDKNKLALCREILCESSECGIHTEDGFRAIVMCIEIIMGYEDGDLAMKKTAGEEKSTWKD